MTRCPLSADLQSFLTKMVRDPDGHITATLKEEGFNTLNSISYLNKALIETLEYYKSGAKFGLSNAEKLQLIMASNYMIVMSLYKDISDLSIYDVNEFQKWSLHYIEKRYPYFCNEYDKRGIPTEDRLSEWMKVQFETNNKPRKIHECDTVIETEYNTHKHAKITSSPDEDVPVLDMANTESEDSSHTSRTCKADECDADIETELSIHEHTTITKTPTSDDDDISSSANGTPSSDDILSPDDETHTLEDVQLVDSGKLAVSPSGDIFLTSLGELVSHLYYDDVDNTLQANINDIIWNALNYYPCLVVNNVSKAIMDKSEFVNIPLLDKNKNILDQLTCNLMTDVIVQIVKHLMLQNCSDADNMLYKQTDVNIDNNNQLEFGSTHSHEDNHFFIFDDNPCEQSLSFKLGNSSNDGEYPRLGDAAPIIETKCTNACQHDRDLTDHFIFQLDSIYPIDGDRDISVSMTTPDDMHHGYCNVGTFSFLRIDPVNYHKDADVLSVSSDDASFSLSPDAKSMTIPSDDEDETFYSVLPAPKFDSNSFPAPDIPRHIHHTDYI